MKSELPPKLSWKVRSTRTPRSRKMRLDVVADDRQAAFLEAALPVALARDEDRHAVHHRAARVEDLLRVPLGRLFGADRQVADHHVGLRLLQDADYVRGFAGRLLHDFGEVLADAVVGHAALDFHAGARHVRELHGVVGLCEYGLGEVEPHLVLVDVERGDELDVTDVIAAEVNVHQPRHGLFGRCVAVVVHALDERRGAVADADDGNSYLAIAMTVLLGAHAPTSSRTFAFSICVMPSS